MARAYPASPTPASTGNTGEWQALRGELVALLDQVEDQFGRVNQSPEYAGLARRVRDLRHQVGDDRELDRQREALASVKRAVDRFSDRDEPVPTGNPQSVLVSAIEEIRARQGGRPIDLGSFAPQPLQPAQPSPAIEDMSRGVAQIAGRLERLEGELRGQRENGGNVREIASQVQQLTQVVELLAGAVGETGQVKRLEAQILGLGKLMTQAPKLDPATLTRRLDDLSATIERLADLQIQQAERAIQTDKSAERLRLDGSKAQAEAMKAIEAGVRNIYDRIDVIEKNVALSPADLERLTDEMTAFTEAMRAGPMVTIPQTLLNRVDTIANRISELEGSGDTAMTALRDDIGALRETVAQAIEPRFFAIENKLDTLSGKLSAPREDKSVGQIEAQIRQLVARMDQTGEQLNGLARLYETEPRLPDFGGLADLVADRTADAVSRQRVPIMPTISDESLAAIEARISRLLQDNKVKTDHEELAGLYEGIRRVDERLERMERRPDAEPADFSGIYDGIRRVGERLERMESQPLAMPEHAFSDVNDGIRRVDERLERLEAMLQRLDRSEAPLERVDIAPVVEPAPAPFGQQAREEILPLSLETAFAGLGDEDELNVLPVPPMAKRPLARAAEATSPDQPIFDPATVARPPRPQSSLAADGPAPAAAPPAAEAQVPASGLYMSQGPSVSARNTFIEAARRAAQRQNEDAQNSVMGRAMSRLSAKSQAAAAEKPVPAQAPQRPLRASVLSPELQQAGPEDDVLPPQGFLVRYRRPLLLGAALAAVSLLTVNLVYQRMQDGPSATASQPAQLSTPTTGAVGEGNAGPVRQILPQSPALDTAALQAGRLADAQVDPIAVGAIGADDSLLRDNPTMGRRAPDAIPPDATFAPSMPQTMPAELELPPETLGPQALREAAANGDMRAQFEIAAIYTEGRAVTQDLAAAATWYERAAAQGFAPAQYRLGSFYEAGKGVTADLEQARLWYTRAAEAGNRMSMHNLASLYAGGELGTQDFESAARWFEEAAERGLKDSQFNLGMLYARGLGVAQDFEQSYKWFSLAALQGDADAARSRDDVARSLDADAVGRLNDQIAAWQAQPMALQANFAPLGTWSPSFDPGQPITTAEVVTKVQTLLNRLGYDIGRPDGMAGPKTVEAIKSFERATGMTEVGAINPRLLAVLSSQAV